MSTSSSATTTPQNVAVIGGGLAGLSVSYHILKKSLGKSCVTVFDVTEKPGEGGASSVAGGLLHPFTPRGKIFQPNGLECLNASKHLINIASCYITKNNDKEHGKNDAVVLRDRLYRIALTEDDAKRLRETACKYPDLARWFHVDDMKRIPLSLGQPNDEVSPPSVLGALELSGGCCVIHVPTYLKGLWMACQDFNKTEDGGNSDHNNDHNHGDLISKLIEEILSSSRNKNLENDDNNKILQKFPVELVRGQSIEMMVDDVHWNGCDVDDTNKRKKEESSGEIKKHPPAILCGKYISPLPTPASSMKNQRHILIGSTHEYGFKKEDILSSQAVIDELRTKTIKFAPSFVWNDDEDEMHNNRHMMDKIVKITSGVRVQSRRGHYGRVPIIGRLIPRSSDQHGKKYDEQLGSVSSLSRKSWIYTGLSSRGLLQHSFYGEALADAILNKESDDGERILYNSFPFLDWWR